MDNTGNPAGNGTRRTHRATVANVSRRLFEGRDGRAPQQVLAGRASTVVGTNAKPLQPICSSGRRLAASNGETAFETKASTLAQQSHDRTHLPAGHTQFSKQNKTTWQQLEMVRARPCDASFGNSFSARGHPAVSDRLGLTFQGKSCL
jgi:hypothetical protein